MVSYPGMSDNKVMMIKKKFLAKKKRIILKKRSQSRNPSSGRTKEEAAALRHQARIFLMFASLKESGLKKLQELGYDGYQNKCFIERHGVAHDYMWTLQMRDDFKPKFFELVTSYMAKDLMPYIGTILRGREASKGAQIVFPDEIGKALAVRNINATADKDDEEFRNAFFGFKPKLKKKVK